MFSTFIKVTAQKYEMKRCERGDFFLSYVPAVALNVFKCDCVKVKGQWP